MGKDTKIEWSTHTFNPWRGCTKISPGCAHCYAEAMSGQNPSVLGVWGPNGTRVVASEAKWREPLAWDKAAAKAGERHRVFCASLADVFEDWRGPIVNSAKRTLGTWHGSWPWAPTTAPVIEGNGFRALKLDDVRERLFALIRETPHLDWLLLTKRPERWRRCWPLVPVPGHVRQNEGDGKDWEKFPNLWQGVSVEDRKHGLPRIDVLREIPAVVRFLSIEPLLEDLGPIDLTGIHWAIVGGESGHGARYFDMRWARSLRDQCRAAGVAFFMKQAGANVIDSGGGDGTFADLWPEDTASMFCPVDHTHYVRLRDKKGGDWSEWPEDLRVREMPAVKGVAS